MGMQTTFEEVLNNLSKLKSTIVSEDTNNINYSEARYYFVPVYKDDKIFICGWCNTMLMENENVVILDPSVLSIQSDYMYPIISKKCSTIDFEIIRLLKEILWDKLIDETEALIEKNSFIYPYKSSVE